MTKKPTIYTIGHSNRSLAEFLELLHENRIECLVDVRSTPYSRSNPQFNKDSLPDSLAAEKIAYEHLELLGGRRSKRKALDPSPNGFWENDSFKNYADYAMGAGFRQGLQELEALAATQRVAIMCAEAVWWRCHRRIITDYLIAQGYQVMHIMGTGKTVPAEINAAARVQDDGVLVYIQET